MIRMSTPRSTQCLVARTLQAFALLGLADDEPVCLLAADHDLARAETRLGPAAQFLAAHSVRVALQPVASEAAPAALILEEVRRRRPPSVGDGRSRAPSRPRSLLHVGHPRGAARRVSARVRRSVTLDLLVMTLSTPGARRRRESG
jgi:hypothetical protein